MALERDDIVQVLSREEYPILEQAEKAGVRPDVFYRKLREFKVAYPDTWKQEVRNWLGHAGDDMEKEARLDRIRNEIRAKKIAILEQLHEDEEESLLEELAGLNKKLGLNKKQEEPEKPQTMKKGAKSAPKE